MQTQTSNFKIIFFGVLIAGAVFGVMVFAGMINIGGSSSSAADVQGNVILWGTIPQTSIAGYISNFNALNPKISVTYVQRDPASFDNDLVEALASGNSPDLVLLPDTLIWRFRDRMLHIPFTSVPMATFQNTFTGGSDIFGMNDGFIALPWASDPLVMYYNRDLLQGVGIVNPASDWKSFVDSVPLLVKKQSDQTVDQAAVGLGTYKNITHAKDILAMLFMQSGNNFVDLDNTGYINVHFGSTSSVADRSAASQSLNFYTSFSDPTKQVYTWNQAQQRDYDLFIQSNLAYYFGSSSELPTMRAQNPNLNFGVALPPQSPKTPTLTTGVIYGLAIPKIAKNQLLSYTAATLLVGAASEQSLVDKASTTLALMPVRRDVLAQKPTSDPFLGILYTASLVEKTWLDPNPAVSDKAFLDLVQNVNSSVLTPDEAMSKSATELLTLSSSI